MLAKTANTEDLRVRRTRHLLQEKFWELLSEKSFQSITVQDITGRAMVNRATFYDHFIDKYALLQYSIHEWFRETLQNQALAADGSVDHLPGLISTTCEFLAQLRYHCLPRDNAILPLVETTITGLIAEMLVPSIPRTNPDPQLAAAVAGWAIYGAALYWSQQEQREPVQEFVRRVLPTIQASLGSSVAFAVEGG